MAHHGAARQQLHMPVLLFQQAAERVGVGLLSLQVVDGDLCAFTGEGDGHGASDSRIAARNQGSAALETAVPAVALLPGVGFGIHPLFQSGRRLVLLRIVVVIIFFARVHEYVALCIFSFHGRFDLV